MTPDAELLRRYAQEGSETAFAELVDRHLNLVYAVALRVAGGNPGVAEDVAQAVFTDLARKSGHLWRRDGLVGWLHTSARFAAAKAARAHARRQAREQKALRMHEEAGAEDSTWAQLRPLLDAAVGRLNQPDREAVLLRYFEGKELREIGAALGLKENAARMRVERALDKLRRDLRRRGVTLSTALLSAALLCQAATAAPAGLGAGLAATAIAGATAGAGLSWTSFTFMHATNLKLGLTTLIILGGLGGAWLGQRRALGQLEAENARLRARVERAFANPASETDAKATQPTGEELARWRKEHGELLRLRGEVARLRQNLATASNAVPPAAEAVDPAEPAWPPSVSHFVASVQANLGSRQTLLTGGWSTQPGKRALVLVTPQFSPGDTSVELQCRILEAPDEFFTSAGIEALAATARETSAQRIMSIDEANALVKLGESTPGVDLLSSPRVSTGDGRQAQVQVVDYKTVPGAANPVPIGPTFNLVPRLSADGASVDLSLTAELNLLNDLAGPN